MCDIKRVDYFKKAQIAEGHEIHVEEELVTQTCDCMSSRLF